MVELNLNIVIDYEIRRYNEIMVANRAQEQGSLVFTLALVVFVENGALADNFEIGDETALFEVGISDHSYFIDLHSLSNEQTSLRLCHLLFVLKIIFKVVDVTNLRRNRYAIAICSSDLPIILKCFSSCLAELRENQVT